MNFAPAPTSDRYCAGLHVITGACSLQCEVGNVPTLLSELTASGLVLWRLRWSTHYQLWCSVRERDGELVLVVHETDTARVVVTESHDDVRLVVERSQDLCDRYVSSGWELVDVDLDEP